MRRRRPHKSRMRAACSKAPVSVRPRSTTCAILSTCNVPKRGLGYSSGCRPNSAEPTRPASREIEPLRAGPNMAANAPTFMMATSLPRSCSPRAMETYPKRARRAPQLSKGCPEVVQKCSASGDLVQFLPALAALGVIAWSTLAHFGKTSHNSAPIPTICPSVGRVWPILANIDECWSKLVKFWPRLADIWPTCTASGRDWREFGLPTVPKLRRCWPKLPNKDLEQTHIGQRWPTLAQPSAPGTTFGRLRGSPGSPKITFRDAVWRPTVRHLSGNLNISTIPGLSGDAGITTQLESETTPQMPLEPSQHLSNSTKLWPYPPQTFGRRHSAFD